MPRKGYRSVTLPSHLLREGQKAMQRDTGKRYHSLAELVSEALEEKLEALKGAPISSTKEVSREDAKHMIIDYLQDNAGFHYPSDLASSLGLDLELVFEITESLLREQIAETTAKKEIEAR